ncbi:MAG: hypothetical protein P8Y92_01460 [Halioglobus sp.]
MFTQIIVLPAGPRHYNAAVDVDAITSKVISTITGITAITSARDIVVATIARAASTATTTDEE